MNPKLAAALRWLSAFGMLLPGTALLAFGEVLSGDDGRLRLWKGAAILLCGLGGFALGELERALGPRAGKGLFAVFKGSGALLCPGLFLWALKGPAGLGQAVFAALLCAAAWGAGLAASRRSYGEILTPGVFYGGLLCFAAAPLTRWVKGVFAPQSYPLDILTGGLFLFGAAFAFCRNQSNIDHLMQRRRHRMEHLPGRIRRYNLLLMAGLLAVVLLGFCFRASIAGALKAVGQMLLWLLALAVRAAVFLAGLFAGETASEAAGDGGMPPLPEFMVEEGRERDNTWVIVLFSLFFIWLLWLKRREIFAWLRRGWDGALRLIKKLFGERKALFPQEGSEYYEDRVESLQPRPRESREGRFGARHWKRRCRELLRRPGGAEDVRESYRLMLRWLSLKGEAPSPGETPEEFCRAAMEAAGEDWTAPTRAYCRVRYGELSPTGAEWETMKEALRALEEKM